MMEMKVYVQEEGNGAVVTTYRDEKKRKKKIKFICIQIRNIGLILSIGICAIVGCCLENLYTLDSDMVRVRL